MTVCNYYPKFEPNQVLTAKQLNELTAYFDKLDRLTRSKLIGVGIVCGFEVSTEKPVDSDRAPGSINLIVSEGVGVTSKGYPVYLSRSAFTKFRSYKDPGRYKKFGNEEAQIQLLELLSPEENIEGDETVKNLTSNDLDNKAVILYLERKEVDLETCTGDDCDEKGKRIYYCVKVLLINLRDLKEIITGCPSFEYRKKFSKETVSEFDLPEISVKREFNLISLIKPAEITVSKRPALTYEYLYKYYYRFLVEPSLKKIDGALNAAYKSFAPVLSSDYNTNPFDKIDIVNIVKKMADEFNFGIQYVYDFIKDIIDAYNEFKEAAFDLSAECCFDEECFSRHLMLGRAKHEESCRPSEYRHTFIQPPIYNGQNELLKKVKMLFKRLVYISSAFHIETGKSVKVKITPSKEKKSQLSDKTIPYYYKPNDKDPLMKKEVYLHHIWNYTFLKKCKPYLNLGYYSYLYKDENIPVFITDPLQYETDDYNFYRIEGHINKSCEVVSELINDVELYNLPFKVIKLRLGAEADSKDFSTDCRFTDTTLIYKSLLAEYICFLNNKMKYFSELDFGSGEKKEVKPGGIEGTLYAEGNEILPGVNVTLTNLSNNNLTGSSTDSKGEFKFSNLQPGQYKVSVSLAGFQSFSQQVIVTEGRTELIKIILKTAMSSGGSTPGITYGGINYSDMSTTEGLGAKYSPEELSSMFTNINYAKGDFFKKAGLKLTENSVGNLYMNYTESGTGDLFMYIENNKDKFSGIIGGLAEGNLIDRYYRPVTLIEKIEELVTVLPEKINNFNYDTVEKKENELIEIAADYRNYIYKNLKDDNYTRTGRESEIIIHLTELIEKCLLKQFKALIDVYKKRVNEILNMTFLANFIKDHPGLVHMAGVPRGGTFIVVCNEEGTVVADFALPYICCSDCPPITYVAAPVHVIFKLPKKAFCIDDDTNYTVIAEPAGGEVKGKGISQDSDSGEYKFNPSEAGAGVIKLTYTYNMNTYEYNVEVIKIDAGFSRTLLKPEPDSSKRKVRFTAVPTGAESYEWDFGDGTDKSIEQNPEHTFDLSDKQEFEITLTVKDKGCSGTKKETINIPYCTAEFTHELKSIVDNYAVVFFDSTMIDAKKYSWDFGDGNKSTKADPINKFDISERTSFDVTLKVDTENCSDKKTIPINIKSCSADFTFDPGGVQGNQYTVYFTPVFAEAEEYIWDFGDNSNTKGFANIEHTYTLKEEEQKVIVTLKVKSQNGICTAVKKEEIKLPPAEKIDFKLITDDLEFCKKDTNSYDFKLSTDGKVTGPGVTGDNNDYTFSPSKSDLDEITHTFIFRADSGRQAKFSVKVYNPIADFNIIKITKPNPETNSTDYLINVENSSTGAEKYIWRLDEKKISDRENPKIIIPEDEAGNEYKLSLTALNGKCYDNKTKELVLPTVAPSDGDGISFTVYDPDTVIGGEGGTDTSVSDNIVAVFNNNIKVLNNFPELSSFDSALSINVAAYRDTKKYLNTVSEELIKPESRKLYISGAKNNEMAESIFGLMTTTAKRIEKYEGTGALANKQFTYNIILLLLSQLFNLLSLQKKDIEPGESLEVIFKRIGKLLMSIGNMKVNLNPNDRFNKMINSATKAAEGKQVLSTLLENMRNVINE